MKEQEETETKKVYVKAKDRIGQRFGKLVILELDHHGKQGEAYFKCKCDCGNIKVIPFGGMRVGTTVSCGCVYEQHKKDIVLYRKDQTKHGGCHTRLYRIWGGMRNRCNSRGKPGSKLYGDRGISVCPEWQDFGVFRDWALANGYRDDLTIDRIDVNGNYEPNNCRWATKKQQGQNRRNTFYVNYNGVEMSLKEVCEIERVPYQTVWKRIRKYGMDLDSALHTEPVRGRRLNHAK